MWFIGACETVSTGPNGAWVAVTRGNQKHTHDSTRSTRNGSRTRNAQPTYCSRLPPLDTSYWHARRLGSKMIGRPRPLCYGSSGKTTVQRPVSKRPVSKRPGMTPLTLLKRYRQREEKRHARKGGQADASGAPVACSAFTVISLAQRRPRAIVAVLTLVLTALGACLHLARGDSSAAAAAVEPTGSEAFVGGDGGRGAAASTPAAHSFDALHSSRAARNRDRNVQRRRAERRANKTLPEPLAVEARLGLVDRGGAHRRTVAAAVAADALSAGATLVGLGGRGSGAPDDRENARGSALGVLGGVSDGPWRPFALDPSRWVAVARDGTQDGPSAARTRPFRPQPGAGGLPDALTPVPAPSPCVHLEPGPAAGDAYPHVLPKTVFADDGDSGGDYSGSGGGGGGVGNGGAGNVSGGVGGVGARFVFVAGLEGSGHHLLSLLFEACKHEVATPSEEGGIAGGTAGSATIAGGASGGAEPEAMVVSTASVRAAARAVARADPPVWFCRGPLGSPFYGPRHESGLMGSWREKGGSDGGSGGRRGESKGGSNGGLAVGLAGVDSMLEVVRAEVARGALHGGVVALNTLSGTPGMGSYPNFGMGCRATKVSVPTLPNSLGQPAKELCHRAPAERRVLSSPRVDSGTNTRFFLPLVLSAFLV